MTEPTFYKHNNIFVDLHVYGYGCTPALTSEIRDSLNESGIKSIVRGEWHPSYAPFLEIETIVNLIGYLGPAIASGLIVELIIASLKAVTRAAKNTRDANKMPRLAKTTIRASEFDIVLFGDPRKYERSLSELIEEALSLVSEKLTRSDATIEGIYYPVNIQDGEKYLCGIPFQNEDNGIWAARYFEDAEYVVVAYDSNNERIIENVTVEFDDSIA